MQAALKYKAADTEKAGVMKTKAFGETGLHQAEDLRHIKNTVVTSHSETPATEFQQSTSSKLRKALLEMVLLEWP